MTRERERGIEPCFETQPLAMSELSASKTAAACSSFRLLFSRFRGGTERGAALHDHAFEVRLFGGCEANLG